MRMTNGHRLIAWALILLGASGASAAVAGTVALTFDDLPVFGRYATAAEGAAVTAALVGGLHRHHFVATGFVNEMQLVGDDPPARTRLLDAWLDAGMDLGNHGYAHMSLNATPVDAYIADVEKGSVVTGRLLAARGRRERWFRYPYLATGLSAETRHRFETWLDAHGYRVAPVTMENSDWQFAPRYDDALARGDAAEAARIRQRYLVFTARIIAWYKVAARQLLGREPAFVFLMHASRLNAVSIDALAALLHDAHLRVVPLDRAMRDPAYAIPDTYVGPDGIEWLERWSLTLHRDLPFDSIPMAPPDIVAADEPAAADIAPATVAPH